MLHVDLLNEGERARYDAAYAEAANTIHDCVLFYLDALNEIMKLAYADGKDHHLTSLMLMMDFAESIDATGVLVRSGSAQKCGNLLRSALECQLGLFYIWENKADYERRSLAYEVAHLHKRLKGFQKLDKDSQAGKQLRSALKDDPFADVFDVTGIDAKKEIQDAEQRLASPRYTAIEREWQRVKKEKKEPRHWYSLWNGPKDLEALAERLGKKSAYEALYRPWSATIHVEDALHRVLGKKGAEIQLNPIRSPQGLKGICRVATYLTIETAIHAIQKLAEHLWPRFQKRYLEELRGKIKALENLSGL